MEDKSLTEQRFQPLIIIVSILIPAVVVALFSIKLSDFGYDVKPLTFLPPIYAGINALTAIILVLGFLAIKNGKIPLHKKLMTTAIILSILFLLMYVAYHMTSDTTKYGGSRGVMFVYFFILISHIILSIAIIPLVLITYVRALAERFDRHKKIARYTFPLWLYVACSGVVVYLMISPYYAQ